MAPSNLISLHNDSDIPADEDMERTWSKEELINQRYDINPGSPDDDQIFFYDYDNGLDKQEKEENYV